MTDNNFREALLRETREELARADAKASILLAASGIAFAALLALGDESPWYPDELSHKWARPAAWIAIALTLGIAFVGAAVKPRLRSAPRRPGRPDYFGDVVMHRPGWRQLRSRKRALADGRRAFAKELERASTARESQDRLDDQIWHLSHIANRKYRLVSIGMWFYALAAGTATFALVVEKEWV